MTNKSFRGKPLLERIAAVRALMDAGHSNKSAAKELDVKPGVVAGLRTRYNIPSKNPPGFKARAKSSSGYLLHLATSEATRCKAKVGEYVCRYEQEPGSDFCARPEHQALVKKGGAIMSIDRLSPCVRFCSADECDVDVPNEFITIHFRRLADGRVISFNERWSSDSLRRPSKQVVKEAELLALEALTKKRGEAGHA